MDAELNTNLNFFGSPLTGYPLVHQSNNYNERVSIHDEQEKIKYDPLKTDDLSTIWNTNHRDNIDDLDVVLRDANINAVHSAQYYGAENLNSLKGACADPMEFSKYLKVNDIDDSLHLPCASANNGVVNTSKPPMICANPKKQCDTKFWLIFIIIVVAIFFGLQSTTNSEPDKSIPAVLETSTSDKSIPIPAAPIQSNSIQPVIAPVV